MDLKYFNLLSGFKGLLAVIIFCGVSIAQNVDSMSHNPILNLNLRIYPDNIFKGVVKLNNIDMPESYISNSELFSGLRDPYIKQFLEEEAIKNNLRRYIQNSAPPKEAEEITAIRKYLGISRDIFALILAIIHVMTY